jgi:C_GCAxxG_C_C family probable redox protein
MIMNREEAVQRALKYADEGFLCVEAVLKTLADLKGIESELIPAIASGLAAGVARTSQICGAVTGAILGLGLWFGRNEPIVSDKRPYWYSRLFIDRWLEAHSDTNCSMLLGVDLDKPQGYAVFQEKNYWENKCKKYIRDAVGLAYDILMEEDVYYVGA